MTFVVAGVLLIVVVCIVLLLNVGCCHCTVDMPCCCTFILFMFAVFGFYVFPCCCLSFVTYEIRSCHLCTIIMCVCALCVCHLFRFGRFVLGLFTHKHFVLQKIETKRIRE